MIYGNWNTKLKERYENEDINIEELSEDERTEIIMMLFSDYQERINELRKESTTLSRLCMVNFTATIALAVLLTISMII